MNKTFQKIMTTLISYFLQGLLVVVPLAATFYVLFSLFVFIDNLLPFEYPGIGALILLTSLTFLGFLAKSIIANPIARYLEGLLKQAPLIKTIFTAF